MSDDDHRSWRARRRPQRIPRQVILLVIILVGMLVLLHYFRAWLDELNVGGGNPTDASVATQPEGPTNAAAELVVDETIDTPPSPIVAEAPATAIAPLEPLKVVLLPARLGSLDPAAAIPLDAIRQATLRALRGMPNVEVIDVGPAEFAAIAPANAGSLRTDRLLRFAVERQYGDGTAAEIDVEDSSDGTNWSIGLDVIRSSGGGIFTGTTVSRDGVPGPGNDAESIGLRYAEVIADDDARAFAPIAAAARNLLFDVTRSEQERVQALATLGERRLDSATIAAAVNLAARSASAETRKQVWNVLRRTYDASLELPMSNTLLSDPDAAVRTEAALGLRRYLDTTGGRAALASAARSDSSAQVRLAARLAMMDREEQQALYHEILLDRNLTPAERLAPRMLAAGESGMSLSGSPDPAKTAEEVLAYAEIVSSTEDSDVRLAALSALQQATRGMQYFGRQRFDLRPEVVRVLIETSEVADERVRRAALQTMLQHAQDPEIRAALETVVEKEPELAEELRIPASLARPPLPTSGTQIP